MSKTRIPYAAGSDGESWPVVTGCSFGCGFCWARAIYHRFGRSFVPTFHADALEAPQHWRRPRRVLVAFTGDLWDRAITNEEIVEVFVAMACAPRHTYLTLTKSAERMFRWSEWLRSLGGIATWARAACLAGLENTKVPDVFPHWVGVSVTNQAEAKERAKWLLRFPAATHWLSCEPLRGPIDLEPLRYHLTRPGEPGINWVVAAGQSGQKAVPLKLKWVRALRDACAECDGAAFMFKDQTGFPPLDGVVHDACPWMRQ